MVTRTTQFCELIFDFAINQQKTCGGGGGEGASYDFSERVDIASGLIGTTNKVRLNCLRRCLILADS